MLRNKKLIIICACALGAVLLCVGITLAYLGAAQKKENQVNVGVGNVSIQESDWSEPSTQSMENTNAKSVKVENTGTVPCFVRVYMEFSDSEVASVAKVTGADNTEYAWDSFKNTLAAVTNTTADSWKYIATDATNPNLAGYFYYTSPVAPGGKTSQLIKQVKTDYNGNNNTDSNIDKIKAYDIIVYSETVQTIGTDGTDYGSNSYSGTHAGWYDAWASFLK